MTADRAGRILSQIKREPGLGGVCDVVA